MGQTSILGGKRVVLLALVLLLLAGAAVARAERKVLLTWYCLHGLKEAEGDAVQTWAERTAALDEAVVPELLRVPFISCASRITSTTYCLQANWSI